MRRGAAVLVLAAAAALLPPARSAAEEPQAFGDVILARAKAVYRSYPRPPFIAYTLRRRDRKGGLPDFGNSYSVKVWCRYADRSALQRRAHGTNAYGALENVVVAFDGAVDPGPPTIDIFEKRLFIDGSDRVAPPASPVPGTLPTPAPLPTIGEVRSKDVDYTVRRFVRDGVLIHLFLDVRGNPRSNRVEELWVDGASYAIRRAVVRDHLYFQFGAASLEDRFDVRFRPGPGGLPLIDTIDGLTEDGVYETHYTFEDVAFPPSMPAWYFDPRSYGAHVSEAPN